MVCQLTNEQDTASACRKQFVCSDPCHLCHSGVIQGVCFGPWFYTVLADTQQKQVKIAALAFVLRRNPVRLKRPRAMARRKINASLEKCVVIHCGNK